MDVLHSVIIRQKNMAQQIGAEIIQQNDIIDEIGWLVHSKLVG